MATTAAFGTPTTSSTNTDTYSGPSATPAVDDLLVVCVALAGSVADNITVTDDQTGGTYTRIDTANRVNDSHRQAIFVRDNLVASAVAHAITVTCTNDPATGALIHAYAVAGMSKTGATAVRQSAKEENQGSGGTPAPTFGSAVLTGNVTIGGVSQTAIASMTEPSGWTEGGENTHSAPNQSYESVFRDSGFTGTTVTWGSTTSGTFSSLIIELDTSEPGGGGATYPGWDGGGWWHHRMRHDGYDRGPLYVPSTREILDLLEAA